MAFATASVGKKMVCPSETPRPCLELTIHVRKTSVIKFPIRQEKGSWAFRRKTITGSIGKCSPLPGELFARLCRSEEINFQVGFSPLIAHQQ